jgi:hypothetical protein
MAFDKEVTGLGFLFDAPTGAPPQRSTRQGFLLK